MALAFWTVHQSLLLHTVQFLLQQLMSVTCVNIKSFYFVIVSTLMWFWNKLLFLPADWNAQYFLSMSIDICLFACYAFIFCVKWDVNFTHYYYSYYSMHTHPQTQWILLPSFYVFHFSRVNSKYWIMIVTCPTTFNLCCVQYVPFYSYMLAE